MTLSFEQVESLISKWSWAKKAQLLYHTSNDMGEIFPGIEKTSGVCGGSACIIRTRIPVWTLVELQQMGTSDATLLEFYPSLRRQDLIAAWAYYDANKKEIDSDIQENNME